MELFHYTLIMTKVVHANLYNNALLPSPITESLPTNILDDEPASTHESSIHEPANSVSQQQQEESSTATTDPNTTTTTTEQQQATATVSQPQQPQTDVLDITK